MLRKNGRFHIDDPDTPSFAALIVGAPGSSEPLRFPDHAFASVADVEDWMPVGEWRDALGRFVLDEIAGRRSHLFVADDGREGAIEEALARRCRRAFRAATLAAPWALTDGLHAIAVGIGEVEPSNVQAHWVRHFEWLRYSRLPYYGSRRYLETVHRDRQRSWWQEWRRIDALLAERTPSMQRLVRVAFEVYLESLSYRRADSALTTLVRCAECLLALPPRPKAAKGESGAAGFANRALQIAPELADDRFLAWGTESHVQLRRLYETRSHIVHGKVPFSNLDSSDDLAEGLARYLYAAETIARGCLLHALDYPEAMEAYKSREEAEDAWHNEVLPRGPRH